MKTLKACRLLALIASLALIMIHLLPEMKGEGGYDWVMIAILVIFLVFLPASLMSKIFREKHPESLTEYKKGYMAMQWAFAGIFICMCIAACILVKDNICLYLAFALATVSNLLNSIILHRVKKEFDAGHQE